MNTRTKVTLSVQSTRDPDKWWRVATVSPEEAMEALDGRGMHANAVDCPHERIAIIVDRGERTETLTVSEFLYGSNTHEQEESVTIHPDTGLRVIPDPPDLFCTGCDELARVEWYDFPEDRVHICGNCGSIAGFPWKGREAARPSRPERAPTRRERPASRVETPQPNRTFTATWANVGSSDDERPTWGARVVVQDGEEVPEGATIRVRSRTGKVARKTAGATVRRLRDRTTGEFIRLVEVS